MIEQAREAWDRGGDPAPLLDQARAAHEQAILFAPEQGFGYNNVGWVLLQHAWYRRGRGEDPGQTMSEAVTAFRKAIDRMGGYVDAWADLGAIHSIQAIYELEQGHDPRTSLDAATAALEEALKRNPREAQTHRYLGEVRGTRARWEADRGHGKSEDFESAAAEYEKAIDADPENHDIRLAFGHFCRLWAAAERTASRDADGQIRRGLDQIERVLGARTELPDALVARADLRFLQAETASRPEERRELAGQAFSDFSKALAQNPNLEHVWRRHATLAQQLSAGPR